MLQSVFDAYSEKKSYREILKTSGESASLVALWEHMKRRASVGETTVRCLNLKARKWNLSCADGGEAVAEGGGGLVGRQDMRVWGLLPGMFNWPLHPPAGCHPRGFSTAAFWQTWVDSLNVLPLFRHQIIGSKCWNRKDFFEIRICLTGAYVCPHPKAY